jgi:shikimate kinase
MKIVLIGFMGAGKSTVARLLAQRLSLPMLETDELIRQRTGVSDLSQIFAEQGEVYFRELERQVAAELGPRDNLVVGTGGGIITNPETLRLLAAVNSRVYYLKISFALASQRVSGDRSRFLFRDPTQAQMLFEKRQSLYEQAANYTVLTDMLSPDQICDEICNDLARYRACTGAA